METKTIDGKEYVEYNSYKVERRKAILNGIFLILLAASILALFMASTTVIKNKEMLISQPIDYVRDKYDFTSCSCTDDKGEIFYSGVSIKELKEGGG